MVKEPCCRTGGVDARPSILKEKTEEAKRLLRYSDKPVTAIGSYLGFSSPEPLFPRVPELCPDNAQRIPAAVRLSAVNRP